MQKAKTNIIRLILAVALLATPTFALAADYINLGTLDVKLANGNEQIETLLKPGQSSHHTLQVSNFSDNPKYLEIYPADAESTAQAFTAKADNELSQDIAPWIKIPTNYIDLDSGETKLISINIVSPENAGVGMHTGAIMVKEQTTTDTSNTINIEKGIRVYVNIDGQAEPNLALSDITKDKTSKFLTTDFTALNDGNTDLQGSFTLLLKDYLGNTIQTQETDIYLKPGEAESVNLAVPKPYLGLYTTELKSNVLNSATQYTQNNLFIPVEIGLLLALLSIGAVLLIFRKGKPNLKLKLSKQELHKTAIFSGIIIASIFAVILIKASGSQNFLMTNVLEKDISPENHWYNLEITIGNVTNLRLPEELTKEFRGSIEFQDADIVLLKKIDSEPGDSITIDQNILNFDVTASNDIDGAEILIKPKFSDTYPTIILTDDIRNRVYELTVDDLFRSSKFFRTSNYGIRFDIEATDEINGDLAPKDEIIEEQQATEEITFNPQIDLESTPDLALRALQSTPDVSEEVEVLESIFEDIPSTQDVFTEYILTSDYVDQVNTENSLTKIDADPRLIKSLEQTPETIQEITATPDLNFVFIPNKKVKFGSQQFSFSKPSMTSQQFGEIIFVQNKETVWNTYVTVTDFVSLSGTATIPASAITIDPGLITVLDDTKDVSVLNKGEIKKFKDSFDESLLVEVLPKDATRAIFSMTPTFHIEVPAGTPPGLYQAEISIKTL